MSYDLKIVNGDLVMQNGSLQTVTNSEKLIQEILKICLTQAGSNPFHPGYGSFLSRTIVGNPVDTDIIVQVAQSQLNTCLTNIQTLQQIQLQSFQIVSADEQLAAILNVSVLRSEKDPRLFNVNINALTKGFKPISTAFQVSTI